MPSKQKSWEDGMRLYSSMGPNPAVVAMFLAEKGVEIPVEKVDLMGGDVKLRSTQSPTNVPGNRPGCQRCTICGKARQRSAQLR